ncbi:MAG TPA: 8-amino-7-oxononanoate synthase [Actinomycetes bacterium]|nr:8-amino-7-oxononanoate synthase [Actinomycetes bacterium]
MTEPPGLAHLHRLAADRERRGMRRVLRPRSADDEVLDLASNDYLGLARDPRVAGAAAQAARRWGAGSTGSRLVTGSTDLHARLEADLAGFVGAEAGLVFSSGYLANLGALTALAGPGALVVSDALNHASVVDACRLSRAAVEVVPHRDVAAVGRVLARRTPGPAVVVTDAVFSVDGGLAPLAELHAVARRHGALLVVDEAHALGVVGDEGRGAAHSAGLAGQPDVVLTVTLSKSLGAQGGAVLGPVIVVEHLVNTARPFIFDTGLAPASVAGAGAALEVLRAEPSLAKAVRSRATGLSADLLAAGLRATVPDAAVVSVLVGGPGPAADAAARLLADGVRVGCFRPPSVPDGVSRLRLTARADLTDGEAARAVAAVAGAVRS